MKSDSSVSHYGEFVDKVVHTIFNCKLKEGTIGESLVVGPSQFEGLFNQK